MKRVFLIVVVALFLFSLVSAVDYPKPVDKYVNDFSGVLSADDSSSIRALFVSVDEKTTAEVVFVSLSSINGSDISQYAVDLGKNWGVGKKDKNNGIVILFVQDEGKIFVATGYGVEGILPDSKVGRLLDENYVPERDSGDLSTGILQFSNALSQVLLDNADEIKSGLTTGTPSSGGLIEAIIIIVVIFAVIIFLRSRTGVKRKGIGFWWFPLFIPSGRSSGGGFSGGGFGGGGFGGGGFGGGGAGR